MTIDKLQGRTALVTGGSRGIRRANVAHLCSEDGRYVTNQRITVSGN